MSPRTGRPTTEPKGNRESFRLSDKDMKKLKYCIKKTGMTKVDIVREGIKANFNINVVKEKNKITSKKEGTSMASKYEKSFEVDKDEIPLECPNCNTEFEFPEDIDISPYQNGTRSVLICPNPDCNFQKILNYTTDEDVERQIKEYYDD